MTPETGLRNWAGNILYRAARVHTPESVAQMREIVRGAAKCRGLGARHSFSTIADTEGDLLSTQNLNRILGLDRARGTVTVEAGIRYGELARYLEAEELALHNLASLPHISVAGAVATGTHGSGDGNPSLATAVRSLDLVTSDGEVRTFTRGDADFPGVVVALGRLGIVVSLTLDVQPTYTVAQTVFEGLTLAALARDFDGIMGSAYSVSLFTPWQPDPANGQPSFSVWRKARSGDPPFPAAAYGLTPADGPRHPIPGISPENCTEQGGIPGPWYERLPHFKLEFLASAGEELQSEYLVPRNHAVAALRAVAGLAERVAPLLMVSEIRTIAADDLWLSPSSGHDSVGLHFTWKPDWAEVRALLPDLEAALAPFDARPHRGKLSTLPANALAALYPRHADFETLRTRLDPEGKFA